MITLLPEGLCVSDSVMMQCRVMCACFTPRFATKFAFTYTSIQLT